MCFSDQFDSQDERDDDGEGESVEEHKSVIMHLLSQVRLGMDLTKVNTTTFCFVRCFSLIHSFRSRFLSTGRLTDIYLGAEVVAGNVCRLLRTPGCVCKVTFELFGMWILQLFFYLAKYFFRLLSQMLLGGMLLQRVDFC